MNLPEKKVIAIDALVVVGVGVLFGFVPGIGAAAIALMWTFPNSLGRRARVVITVLLVVAIVALGVLVAISSATA